MAKQQEVLDKLDDLIETLRAKEPMKNPSPAPVEPVLGKLEETLDELPDKIAAKVAECVPKPREASTTSKTQRNPSRSKNPNAAITRRLDRLQDLRVQRDEVLDAVGDALDALDEGDADNAEDILDEVMQQYEVEEETEENGDD